METLAVVVYRQPVLRAEIEAIRGVQCGEVLRQLIERDLVRIVGRSEELGRPLLYGTTRLFLQVFGLRHLEDLPRTDLLPMTKRVANAVGDTAADSPDEILNPLHHSRETLEETHMKKTLTKQTMPEELGALGLASAPPTETFRASWPSDAVAAKSDEDDDPDEEDEEDEDDLDDEPWEEVDDEDEDLDEDEDWEDEDEDEEWDDDLDEDDDWDDDEDDDWDDDEDEEEEEEDEKGAKEE
jgi:segregation and condensation protein B